MSDDIFDPENLDEELTEVLNNKVQELRDDSMPLGDEIVLDGITLEDFSVDKKHGAFILELNLPEHCRESLAQLIILKKNVFTVLFLPKN